MGKRGGDGRGGLLLLLLLLWGPLVCVWHCGWCGGRGGVVCVYVGLGG